MKVGNVSFKSFLIGLLTILLCFAGGTIASAAIPKMGIECNVCHDMGPGPGKPLLPQYEGPEGCRNCHSSSTSSTTYDLDVTHNEPAIVTVPVVYYTGDTAPTEYLAGGNFWWVKDGKGFGADDTKGHNVFSGEADDYLTDAPGRSSGCTGAGSCHQNLDQTNTSDRAGLQGRQGCTKCHMVDDDNGPTGFHHANDSNLVVGSEIADTDGYFRFLKGHDDADGYGVCGIEDPDWQATSSSTDHNEYLGFSGTKTSAGSLFGLGHTVTGFCTGCHGNFHLEQAEGDWIRHPSDAVLCPDGLDGCECAGYTTYNTQVPVARPVLTDWSGPSETVDPATDLAMCLSCHRAHGSPYPKMLRWDLGGCFNCHTKK